MDTATTDTYTYQHTLPLHDALPIFTTNPGLVWSEYLAQYYGTDASPNDNGQSGDNYAAGGARVGVDTVGGLGPIPSLATQMNNYLAANRSEEHTSELQSLMRISYAVFCLKKKKKTTRTHITS